MYKGTFIIAAGPIIIEDGNLLVNKDEKDDFYKIPGGTIEEGAESLEEACKREFFEENSGKIEIEKPLSPMIIWKNPTTDERMAITLIHYKAKLLNRASERKPLSLYSITDVAPCLLLNRFLSGPRIKGT